MSRGCNQSHANSLHRALYPGWLFTPNSHKGAHRLAVALIKPYPALRSYLLCSCRDWDRRTRRISVSHPCPGLVLCIHSLHFLALKEGGKTSHPVNRKDDSSKMSCWTTSSPYSLHILETLHAPAQQAHLGQPQASPDSHSGCVHLQWGRVGLPPHRETARQWTSGW